jgi:acetyl esterase/lipase
MKRLAVLVGDRPGQVDPALLRMLLGRVAMRSEVDIDVVVVREASLASAWTDAASTADGMLVDAHLARRPSLAAVSTPVVVVDLHTVEPEPSPHGRTIFGRGIDTYVWAARHLVASVRWPPVTIHYGDHRHQLGELRVPTGHGPHPVVVLIHGGFWRSHWELDLMDDLAIDLAGAGLAAWNIEYRRGRQSWEEALADVAAAVDHAVDLAATHDLAADRTALVGHSAGGHLALWAAARRRHGPPAGARAEVLDPALAMPLAPVSDLAECAGRGLGEGAALLFLGAAPESSPERYARADPMARLPVGVRTTIVQGMADSPDLIDLNRRFAARAASHGDDIELLELDGTDHFDVINAGSDAWKRIRNLLVERLVGDPERR